MRFDSNSVTVTGSWNMNLSMNSTPDIVLFFVTGNTLGSGVVVGAGVVVVVVVGGRVVVVVVVGAGVHCALPSGAIMPGRHG